MKSLRVRRPLRAMDTFSAEQGITGMATSPTPVAGRIPIADAAGRLDAWVTPIVVPSSGQRVLQSCLTGTGGFLPVSGTAYWVYLGLTTRSVEIKYAEWYVTTAGAGTQTAEVGLFSTPLPPNKASQTLTKIFATSSISSMTTTGVKRNTSAFGAVPSGVHVWAGIRTAMATTQPTIYGLGMDMAQGQILSRTTAGALTGAGPWSGAIIAAGTAMCCPSVRGTLD